MVGGRMTASITWMMPLLAATSGLIDGGGVVDDDAAVDHGDGDLFALDGGGGLAVEADGGGGVDLTGHDVVGEDVGERLVGEKLFGGEAESVERRSEGVVGRGEDGEGTLTAQRLDETGLGHRSDEGLEAASGNRNIDDRARRLSGVLFSHVVAQEGFGDGRGEDDGVDHVDDAVAGFDVGADDGGGVVDDDVAVDDGDGDLFALDGGGRLAVEADGGGGVDFTGHDVVGEDVGERRVRQELFGGEAEGVEGGGEGVVGRGEDGEGALTGQGLDQTASVTAATRVSKLPAATATSTIVPGSSAISSSAMSEPESSDDSTGSSSLQAAATRARDISNARMRSRGERIWGIPSRNYRGVVSPL